MGLQRPFGQRGHRFSLNASNLLQVRRDHWSYYIHNDSLMRSLAGNLNIIL